MVGADLDRGPQEDGVDAVGCLVEGVAHDPEVVMIVPERHMGDGIHVPIGLEAGEILISAKNRLIADGGDGVRVLLVGEAIPRGEGDRADDDGGGQLGIGREEDAAGIVLAMVEIFRVAHPEREAQGVHIRDRPDGVDIDRGPEDEVALPVVLGEIDVVVVLEADAGGQVDPQRTDGEVVMLILLADSTARRERFPAGSRGRESNRPGRGLAEKSGGRRRLERFQAGCFSYYGS